MAVIDIDVRDALARFISGAANSSGQHVPLVALTRRSNLQTKLEAFDAGVDDILTLPFAPEELLARVRVATRRAYGAAPPIRSAAKFRGLEINIVDRRVSVHGSEVRLTSSELALMYLLAANAGKTLSREEILNNIWGVDYLAEADFVDKQIRNLRLKLKNNWQQPRYIFSVPGGGYRFVKAAATDS